MKRTICERLEAAVPALLVLFYFAILVVVVVNFEATRSWICDGYAVNESCVRELLSEFQTLITGIAAVSAAAFTVLTMQTTDRTQQQRHDHLVALNLRTEYLTLERSIVPFLDELRERAQLASRLHHLVMDLEQDAGPTVWSEVAAVEEAICETQNALVAEEMTDALKYFDGATTRAYRNLLRTAQIGGKTARRIAQKSRDYGAEPDDDFEYWYGGLGGDTAGYDIIVRCLEKLTMAYPPFLARLEEIENRLKDVRARYPNVI